MPPRRKPQKTGKQQRGQSAKKRGRRAVVASDDDMEQFEDAATRQPAFGAEWMLFRMLVIGTAVVSFAASQGNPAAIFATAAAAGAVWARCGADGKDGRSHNAAHFADSRVHRLGREAGFRRPNQAEIDADPMRSRARFTRGFGAR